MAKLLAWLATAVTGCAAGAVLALCLMIAFYSCVVKPHKGSVSTLKPIYILQVTPTPAPTATPAPTPTYTPQQKKQILDAERYILKLQRKIFELSLKGVHL